MSLFRRHNRCRGFRLWKWGTFQIEIWYCPKGEVIEPHIHKRIDSNIVILAGDMTGVIGGRSGHVACPKDFLRSFHVPAGVMHGAAAGRFCIFANLEYWQGEVTSAAEDFTAV